ncbi:YihY/virulence factor BrkB family protein [Tenacibaculum sp. UWU-22]|uniref:YihY/virulence factor BrkB family protein n=1 Tax=Tenacibaculum sp. UWU-22 TaxID=3234187 RepID=UPI0034DADE89
MTTESVEERLLKIPVINLLVKFGKKIKIPGLEGLSLYDVLEMYGIGIIRGALTTRAGGIAFSFFMAIFPFLLFILTLIPYIPIPGFQDSLLALISEVLPPKTFDAVKTVLNDIINNQYGGLLSFGFFLSIFLMTNGVNAIFGGFEHSYHIKEMRSVIKAYFISLAVSLVMAFFLLTTVALTLFFQIGLQKLTVQGWIENDFFWLKLGRGALYILMVFTIVSMLFHYGTKQGKHTKFISPGAILTTLLSICTFYLFGIYVLKFSRYNELYGSIGTLLILMLFIWLNAIILLLGFELNATINRLKQKNKTLVSS